MPIIDVDAGVMTVCFAAEARVVGGEVRRIAEEAFGNWPISITPLDAPGIGSTGFPTGTAAPGTRLIVPGALAAEFAVALAAAAAAALARPVSVKSLTGMPRRLAAKDDEPPSGGGVSATRAPSGGGPMDVVGTKPDVAPAGAPATAVGVGADS